jgi:Xaa-Pro aminopeptidase
VELVPTKSVIEHVRALKDPAEVAAIRQAGGIAEGAFERLLPTLRLGMSEREIARRLDTLMVDLGATRPSFPTIVAAGQNAAQPHAVPGDRPVRAGEPLLIDFGAYADGYCSDFTRTIVVGEPDPRLVELYAIVREAQSAAEAALAAGVRRGRDVDQAAREVIERAGYGEQYLHGTGHGVGMAVHELPSLTRPRPDRGLTSADLAKIEHLEPGHVVTVEPGIYLGDWGGVRLEDMLLVTESGARVLNERNPERVRVIA